MEKKLQNVDLVNKVCLPQLDSALDIKTRSSRRAVPNASQATSQSDYSLSPDGRFTAQVRPFYTIPNILYKCLKLLTMRFQQFAIAKLHQFSESTESSIPIYKTDKSCPLGLEPMKHSSHVKVRSLAVSIFVQYTVLLYVALA